MTATLSFSTLDTTRTHPLSLIISTTLNLAILSVLLLVGISVHSAAIKSKYASTALYLPTPISETRFKVKAPPLAPLPETPTIQVPHFEAPRVAPRLTQTEPPPAIAAPLPDTPMPVIRATAPSAHILLAQQPKAAFSLSTAKPGEGSNPTQSIGGTAFGAAQGVSHGKGQGAVATAFFQGVASRTSQQTQQVATALNVHPAAPQNALLASRQEPAQSSQAELMSAPRPVYTEEAKTLRIQGDVVLRLRVAPDGSATVMEIVRGLGHGLDEAARRAVSQYRFKPAKHDGVSIEQIVTVTVTFQLA